MSENEVVEDIAAASRSCLAAFKDLQRYQSTSDASRTISTIMHMDMTDERSQGEQISAVSHTTSDNVVIEATSRSSQSTVDDTFWEDIEYTFTRFRVWISNTNASERGSSSLDTRLRGLDVVRIAVLRTLKSLQETLIGCRCLFPWE